MSINIKDIQILALEAIEDPDADAQYRDICRFYSKTFATPLHTVEEELPEMEVLRHYYEYHYQQIYDTNRERYLELRSQLLWDDKDEAAADARDQEDDDWAKQMVRDIEESAKAAAAKIATAVAQKKDPITEKEVNITKKGE